MAYHTGHRLDCDTSADPIECFCGDYSSLPLVPRSAKDYARQMCIAVDPATKDGRDETVLLARVLNEQVEVIAMRVLNGTRRD